MIEKRTKEYLLSLEGYVTVMGCPGTGKTSLLNTLGVAYRPEPTEDIETLGIQLSNTEWQQVVQNRFDILDSSPGEFWRDSDFFTSLGLYKSPEAMLEAIPSYRNKLIVSQYLVWLNCPLEQTIQNIIKRNRRSAMMEIENAAIRDARAAQVFKLHPAKNKVILTLNNQSHYKIQLVTH
jgi:ABC-type transporter Mla maintaining outer membrane lipid asymmetry ATPase subunit MlaF